MKALLILIALAGVARADAALDADAANAEGKRLHAAGERVRALARFRLAYALVPEPRFLYNIAFVLEDLGRDAEAADAYAAHIAGAGDGETVSWAHKQLAALEAILGRVVLVGARGAVTVDGKPVDTDRLYVDPGKHTFVSDGVSRTHTIAAGEEVTVDLTPPPVVRRWYRDPLGGALVGAGVISLGVGAGFFAASRDVDDADQYPAHSAAVEDARTQRSVARWTGALGGALVVAGVLRWALHGDERRDQALTVATDGQGVVLCGSF